MLSSERQFLNCFSTIGKGGRYDTLGKTFRQQTYKICQMVKCVFSKINISTWNWGRKRLNNLFFLYSIYMYLF